MWLVITPFIRISTDECELSYVRSSGPGGQNVNKVNSKAVLRWNIDTSPSLAPETKQRIRARLGERVTRGGDLVVASDRFRDQIRNREDCFEKLRSLLAAAAFVPGKRKKTRPSFSSRKKAAEAKSRHSQKKRLRRFSGERD